MASYGARQIVSGTNALSTTAEVVAAARPSRYRIHLHNNDASIVIYVGEDDGVGPTDGLALIAGATITLETTAAIYAEAASGTPSISFLEEFE